MGGHTMTQFKELGTGAGIGYLPKTSGPDNERNKAPKTPKPRRSKQRIRKRRQKAHGKSTYLTFAWRGYNPILDVITDVMEQSGETLEDISIGTGVSTRTLMAYRNKYVSEPRGSCVAAVLRYCHAKYGAWYKGRFYEASPR